MMKEYIILANEGFLTIKGFLDTFICGGENEVIGFYEKYRDGKYGFDIVRYTVSEFVSLCNSNGVDFGSWVARNVWMAE